jgi:arylsulfatase A-like enzyme
MIQRTSLALALLAVLTGVGSAADLTTPSTVVADRPNVVLIFIDDLGYGDVGFNGATIPKTPSLDALAREGTVFNDFYVGAPVCTASRAALLTGAHFQRLGIPAVLFPYSSEGMHPDEVTIADMLKEVGYKTACIGKWHLGHLPPCLPTYQGFDYYYGLPYSNNMWIDPANTLSKNITLREGVTMEDLKAGHKQRDWVPLMEGEEVIEYPADQETLTRRYTEKAISFITENKDRPFFVYLPHTMVHFPLGASEAFRNRHPDMFHNVMEEVNWSVGEIAKTLRELGLAEKTLIIFTSDNGAAPGSSLPLRGKKFSLYDGGIRVPAFMWWPGRIPAGKVCTEVVASIDILPTLAGLCGGKLPDRKIDGLDIWPLMSGQPGAKSPHEAYCVWYGPGTLRSGKWKYYPWPEGAWGGKNDIREGPVSKNKVQLYDTIEDIGETTNLASENPEVVQRLQEVWHAHLAELKANLRPAAHMLRPDNTPSAAQPEQMDKKK